MHNKDGQGTLPLLTFPFYSWTSYWCIVSLVYVYTKSRRDIQVTRVNGYGLITCHVGKKVLNLWNMCHDPLALLHTTHLSWPALTWILFSKVLILKHPYILIAILKVYHRSRWVWQCSFRQCTCPFTTQHWRLCSHIWRKYLASNEQHCFIMYSVSYISSIGNTSSKWYTCRTRCIGSGICSAFQLQPKAPGA